MNATQAHELEISTWKAILAHAEANKIKMAIETWHAHATKIMEDVENDGSLANARGEDIDSYLIRAGAWNEAIEEAAAVRDDDEAHGGMSDLIDSIKIVLEAVSGEQQETVNGKG